jgi:hypothetical protein
MLGFLGSGKANQTKEERHLKWVEVILKSCVIARRTPKKSVPSDVRSVVFEADDVVQAAMLRWYEQQNEIRAVVEWKNGSS